jgi:hypothetical protein
LRSCETSEFQLVLISILMLVLTTIVVNTYGEVRVFPTNQVVKKQVLELKYKSYHEAKLDESERKQLLHTQRRRTSS